MLIKLYLSDTIRGSMSDNRNANDVMYAIGEKFKE